MCHAIIIDQTLMLPPIALLESLDDEEEIMQNEEVKSLETSSILKSFGHSEIKINLAFKLKNLF